MEVHVPFPASVFPKRSSGVATQFGNGLCKYDNGPVSGSSLRVLWKYSFLIQAEVHSSSSSRTKGSLAHVWEVSESDGAIGGRRQKSMNASTHDLRSASELDGSRIMKSSMSENIMTRYGSSSTTSSMVRAGVCEHFIRFRSAMLQVPKTSVLLRESSASSVRVSGICKSVSQL